jgi:hypothetical protein
MDVTMLTPLVLPYLLRYLPAMIEARRVVGSKPLENIFENTTDEDWKIAQPWIEKLMRKIEENPTALYATQRVVSAPEDVSHQIELESVLQEIFAADRKFAEEIKRIFDHDHTSGHGDAVHNAPGTIAIFGGVTQTGDGNIIGYRNQASITKNITAKQGVTPEDLSLLLVQIREQILASDLTKDDREMIEATLRAVEKESKKKQPRLPVIESSLKSIESMVKSTESISSIAAKLLPLVHQAVEFARRLFL